MLPTEQIRLMIKEDKVIKWRHVILILQIGVLGAVLAIPQGNLNFVANILVSFVCALQTQSFRSLKGKSYMSVMCTGNLRSGAEAFFVYRQKKDKRYLKDALEYGSVVAFFVLGALWGKWAAFCHRAFARDINYFVFEKANDSLL